MARAGARAGPFFNGSLRIGRSIAGKRENGEKKPPLPSGYGGRSEEAVPQFGGPHPSSIRRSSGSEMLRPNTTIDATTLPEPSAGLERNTAVDRLRPTIVAGKREGDCASRQAQCFSSPRGYLTNPSVNPSDFMRKRAQGSTPKKCARKRV